VTHVSARSVNHVVLERHGYHKAADASLDL